MDPLAVYNPIMESEFYGDGQHNGGVYNSGNLNPYIYTYNNPIRYIDPNGKQVKSGMLFPIGLSEQYQVRQESQYLEAKGYSPGKSHLKASYNVWSEKFHSILDIVGLVPAVGELFDGINAAWYGLEGDYVNAGLSSSSMVPIAGWESAGVKWLKKTFKISESAASLIKTVGKVGKDSNETLIKTTSNTFADAKKIAEDITGAGDNAVDYVTRVPGSPFNGKVTGKKSGRNLWRVDIDKATGEAHINYSVGKGNKGRIDFGGGDRNAKSIVNNVMNK